MRLHNVIRTLKLVLSILSRARATLYPAGFVPHQPNLGYNTIIKMAHLVVDYLILTKGHVSSHVCLFTSPTLHTSGSLTVVVRVSYGLRLCGHIYLIYCAAQFTVSL